MVTKLIGRWAVWGLALAGLLSGPAQGATIHYLHTDAQGTVVLVTDQDRNVVSRQEYEANGLPRQPVVDQPGYTGHVHDAGSGLVYAQQRYYDPEIGRFLSIDPVGVSNAGSNFNRYWYANNNPYTFVDPDGREVVRQYHRAIGGPVPGYHTSTRITPENQARYQNDGRFLTDPATGLRYATLGAGPEVQLSTQNLSIGSITVTVPRVERKLVGSINRSRDADRSLHPRENDISIAVPDHFANEDAFIDALFNAAENYGNNLDYTLRGENGYNSNSWDVGLHLSVGSEPGMAPVWTPGRDNPVPKEQFETR